MDFRNICIEATCNLNCVYCGGSKVKINENEVIKKLHTIFTKLNKDNTCFRVECFGEITLYKSIVNYLHELCNLGYHIEVLTNGTHLSQPLIQRSQMQWVVSLDGHTENMNKARHLKQEQVDAILKLILQYNLEIQCVYYEQTIEEINELIAYLDSRKYDGLLHIFPYRAPKNIDSMRRAINYDKLIKAKFLPPQEYFLRWNYIVQNRKRNFVCDIMNNGYVYRINNDGINMVKCDCNALSFRYEHGFGDERQYKVFPCGICLTHYEYNNQRKFISKEVDIL